MVSCELFLKKWNQVKTACKCILKLGPSYYSTTTRVDSALIEPRSFVGLVISLSRAKDILRYLAYTHKELAIGLTEM